LTFNRDFSVPEKVIGPGEYFSSVDDVAISTLLGSCVAVALYDRVAQMGGLNHFMLPVPKGTVIHPHIDAQSARYGVNAMELLINDLMKKGAERKRLRAKVFGASSVLYYEQEATFNVPKMNIEFIFEFLEMERIPVDAYSVGGSLPRKVYFFPRTAKVLMKYTKMASGSLSRRETRYAIALREAEKNDGKPVLF
jgi:chemotaxis protein CheD